jgi:3-hydroxyacyl-CoA dehydrogenase
MQQVVNFEIRGNVGLILVDHPPVNAIDFATRRGLSAAIAEAAASQAKVLLLACSGQTFMAGVDIKEFDAPMKAPLLAEIQRQLENSAKPVVAAIHGAALGGGLELALACHYRIATKSASVGLPEITLGIIPGAGGTQRLSRLIGARAAFEMMLSGKSIKAEEALALGVLDAIVDGDLIERAVAYCKMLIAGGVGPRPVSILTVDSTGFEDGAIASVLKVNARSLKGRTTQIALIESIKAAIELPFDEGLAVELRLALNALASRESAALRHMFFAERRAGNVAGIPKLSGEKKIHRVAVVGAGTMGSGIATAFADAGLPVVLIDSDVKGLERGKKLIADNYASNVKRGRMSEAAAAARMAQIEGSLDLAAAAESDVIVEAVFEDLELKKRVLAAIDAAGSSEALIATNTSSLSVTEMARATTRPNRVVGLHFFNPANVMPLLEIVRGAESDPLSLARSLQVAKILRKIGVVSGDAFGFIGNRMMLDGYFREAELLMLEGASPSDVDDALESFGFPMGPNRVSDLGGNDVGTKTRAELLKTQTRADPYFVIADALTGLGRFGQKSGLGFYKYEEGGRVAVADPEVERLIASLAAERQIVRRVLDKEEIVERCLLALINVGAALLDEGIAIRPSDIDVVWCAGYGFPRHKGGPMFHADTLGLAHVLERLRHYHGALGEYWKPTRLVEDLARTHSSFEQWSDGR